MKKSKIRAKGDKKELHVQFFFIFTLKIFQLPTKTPF